MNLDPKDLFAPALDNIQLVDKHVRQSKAPRHLLPSKEGYWKTQQQQEQQQQEEEGSGDGGDGGGDGNASGGGGGVLVVVLVVLVVVVMVVMVVMVQVAMVVMVMVLMTMEMVQQVMVMTKVETMVEVEMMRKGTATMKMVRRRGRRRNEPGSIVRGRRRKSRRFRRQMLKWNPGRRSRTRRNNRMRIKKLLLVRWWKYRGWRNRFLKMKMWMSILFLMVCCSCVYFFGTFLRFVSTRSVCCRSLSDVVIWTD